MEENRSSFNILTGKLTVNRPLGKPRSILNDNILMDLKEIGVNMRNFVHLAQNLNYWRALVNAAFDLRGSIDHVFNGDDDNDDDDYYYGISFLLF